MAIWMRRTLFVVVVVLTASCTSTSNPPPTSTAPPPSIVPELLGQNRDHARKLVSNADLHISVVTKVAPQRAGTVIAQKPHAGSELPGGGTVRVTVSEGWPTVPDFFSLLSGVAVTAAKMRLQHAGLRFGGLVWKYKDYLSLYAPGRVFASKPPGSKRVAPGTRVALLVAKPYACTPGYSVCLPPHLSGGTLLDYDCAGGIGGGPFYAPYTGVSGDDPYGLDADNNGYAC